MKWLRNLVIAAAALTATATGARADVIFDFLQVGPTMSADQGTGYPVASETQFSGRLTVSDEEYAAGFNFNYQVGSANNPALSAAELAALPDLQLALTAGGFQRVFDNAYLLGYHNPIFLVSYNFSAEPKGALEAFVTIRAPGSLFRFSVREEGTFTAEFGSDDHFPMPGCIADICNAQGIVTVSSPTAVPEPASMALFGVGVVGLGMIRRRRAQA
ncbi:PEP-CTERM sorting domain-containing protein [Pseudoroseomonas wenyumeiae]|uniref:PEP-CTERM sorting domain-containing protein n=1 Tax=Teichococcus wenyumeiae TaxID=2478470 RepID=A0A3A9JAS4_9PROT|nr:PEP-CTERM sorting domain-containing protein [Pseudoroseomonas wenyumeiae]RKK01675.1 PEP-CTERM sorting domain-containing protein [Pseudoroseomonas wenyumeiae]RMI15136.1 PEP-CTERM sorting domain-containing protein [Pseudoroseomonas wenyumeiae]